MKEGRKIIVVFVLIIIIINLAEFLYSNYRKKEIVKTELQISGKIKALKGMTYGHDFGFCLMDIESCNYNEFNYKELDKDFFLLIKNKKCLIVMPHLSSLEIGDRITIDKGELKSYRDGKVILSLDYKPLPLFLVDDHGDLMD